MRFSSVARGVISLVFVTMALSACALLIPESPSVARYNTVEGERRTPQENPGSIRAGQQNTPPVSEPAFVPSPGAAFAPSAPVDTVQTVEPIALVPPAPVVQQAPLPAALPPIAPSPVAIAFPPVDAKTQAIAASRLAAQPRSVPVENTQLARGDSYPILNQIPPAPARSGVDSAQARLDAARADLERERSAAAQAAAHLARDAAAEPSLLSQLPPTSGVAPAPVPVVSAPVPPPLAPVSSVTVPAVNEIRDVSDFPPPPPVFAPAPTPMPATVPQASAPIRMDEKLPMAPSAPFPVASTPAALEPIQLRAPVVATPRPAFIPTPAPQIAAPAYRSLPPAAGSFDPMAGATASASPTLGQGYLPPSRYTYRR